MGLPFERFANFFFQMLLSDILYTSDIFFFLKTVKSRKSYLEVRDEMLKYNGAQPLVNAALPVGTLSS